MRLSFELLPLDGVRTSVVNCIKTVLTSRFLAMTICSELNGSLRNIKKQTCSKRKQVGRGRKPDYFLILLPPKA